jgi:hypothetical protein
MNDMKSALGLLVVAIVMTGTAAAQQPLVQSTATIRQLHESMIKPASDIIFNVGRESPRTHEQWAAISRAGATLFKSGNLLMLALPAQDRAQWIRLSRQLATAGPTVRKSAEARNLGVLMRTSDRLVIICETCHARYRKQKPQE